MVRFQFVSIALLVLGWPMTVAASEAAKPLSEAAKAFESSLPKGCLVTAEWRDDRVDFSNVGFLEPPGVRPEKILFEIGSTTKVFNGLLLAQAVVDGRVSLDSTLRQLLPVQRFSDPRVGKITLRQLATHTSGLPASADDFLEGADPTDPFAHYDRTRLLGWLNRVRLVGEEPFGIAYSNFGSGLLGDVLSQIYGKEWADLIREKVTGPLGLDDTVARLSPEQKRRFAPAYRGEENVKPFTFTALEGAGGLKSTAFDMVRFGKALLEPEVTPLEDAIQLLLQPQNQDANMGLAIAFYQSHGQLAYGHDGLTHGFSCVFEVLPHQPAVRVILVNNAFLEGRVLIANSHGETTRYDLLERTVAEEELAEFEGRYRIDKNEHFKNSQFVIVRRKDRLFGKLERIPSSEPFLHLRPHKRPDLFFLREVEARYRFHRHNGKVESLTFTQGGTQLHAVRTDRKGHDGGVESN